MLLFNGDGMAVRPLIKFSSLLLLLLLAGPSLACFGPKLYLGVGDDATGQVLASFVAIYIKEATGTEVERVPLDGRDPAAEIVAEQIDFAFVDPLPAGRSSLLQIEALPPLMSGPRIEDDLQFTTVRPALTRLAAKLTAADVTSLAKKVAAGELPMDVVRTFLIDRRWI